MPNLDVAVAHGQMESDDLEKVLLDFIEGEHELLVCTNIIETGLDIPNANTIIINNAHHFGLSDLHQLRGRVGRSNRKAYCYLLTPPLSTLTNDARKRLQTIEQFAELGSGIQIAMRDLDIRGAGNLLGGEQSGFISEIGFEMYQKILNEAMQELRESEFKELFDDRQTDSFHSFVQDCIFETDMEVRIPDNYVNNVAERLSLYQELDNLKNQEELEAFAVRLKDRFGPVPKEVKELLFSFQLRWLAQNMGLERLVIKSGKMVGYFIANPQSPFFETETFTTLLNRIMTIGQGYRLVQQNEKLRLVIEPVKHIKDAFEKLGVLVG
jgi:transcription-repair coupling factor (superfamily II helicase)